MFLYIFQFFTGKHNSGPKQLLEEAGNSISQPPIQALPLDVLRIILSMLDQASLMHVAQLNRFFNGHAKDDIVWKQRVNQCLTMVPRLKTNENYYSFFLRCKPYLLAISNLAQINDPKEILSLMYQVAEAGLEVLFFTIIEQRPEIMAQAKNFKHDAHHKKTLVHAAVAGNNVAILQKLIESGVSLTARCEGRVIKCNSHANSGEDEFWLDNCGESPLDIAAMNGSYECMGILLQKGISPNESQGHEELPLHYAARAGHLSCVQLLVINGAKLNVKNGKSDSSYELAKKERHEAVANYLAEEMQKQNIIVPHEKKYQSVLSYCD